VEKGYFFPEIPTVVSAQQLSIMLEVGGDPKPGNVTEKMGFSDLDYDDFVLSAVSVGKPLAEWYGEARRRHEAGMLVGGTWGGALLDTTKRAMRGRSNAIFGTLLMGIPLGIGASLSGTRNEIVPMANKLVEESDVADSLDFKRAVDVCHIGGLSHQYMDGGARDLDLLNPGFEDRIREGEVTLGNLLALSTDYDLIAAEVTGEYPITRKHAPLYLGLLGDFQDPVKASGLLYCTLLSKYPDTLVTRKAGREESERVRGMAELAMELDPYSEAWNQSMKDLDLYLRKRDLNPGTLADIASASIFLALLGTGD
jgi:triphosphoribosyl-dephospho-CoA synthase